MEPGIATAQGRVTTTDPFGITRDPALVHAADAIDPQKVEYAFARSRHKLEKLSKMRLESIRVVRHKWGRRCVIEYGLSKPNGKGRTTLIGKIRRRRSGSGAFQLARSLSAAGFDCASSDGISVPDAVAYVKELGLWLQRKVPGCEMTWLLSTPAGPQLGTWVADSAIKIHQAGVPTARAHGIEDELRILFDGLDKVADAVPAWKSRIERMKQCAERIANSLSGRPLCGIHRDYYSDQIIVDRDRLWLLDFDLYCEGDPALDIGNFIAHVTEQSLRQFGDPLALLPVEKAIERRYSELTDPAELPAIRIYALLSLMRHIYISGQLDDRRHLTERLLSICEMRTVNLLCGRGYRI